MLDVDYIEYMFKSLPSDKRKELQIKLFGDTKQTMNYFRKVKDPGLSKLEILADSFGMPIDSLRVDSKFRHSPSREDSISNVIAKDERFKEEPTEQVNLYENYLRFNKLLKSLADSGQDKSSIIAPMIISCMDYIKQ